MKIKYLLLFAALCSLPLHPASASYDFSAANSTMLGTFNATYTVPITIGCWTRFADHPASTDYVMALHRDANLDEYIALLTSSTADRFDAVQADATTGNNAQYISSAGEYDGVWLPWVMTSESTSVWNIFIELITNTDVQSSTTRDPGAIGEISVGTAPNGAGDWINFIAECAIWNGELSNADVTSYLGGVCAANIDSANLIGYWPMDASSATQTNEGTDIGGDLTVSNAVFDAAHPTIVCGIMPLAYEYYLQGN